MAQITRTITVPFKGCDRCRYLTISENVVYADGYAYVAFDRCEHENICLNAAKIAKDEEEAGR